MVKDSVGRLTYQDAKKLLNVSDKKIREYIRGKKLIPRTTLYSQGPFFDLGEVRKIVNENTGMDLLPDQIYMTLLPEEITEDRKIQKILLNDILLKYGLKKDTVLSWIVQNKIKAHKENGEIYIKTSDLENMFQKNMDKEKKKDVYKALEKIDNIEERMGLVVRRIKTLYSHVMSRVGKELQELQGLQSKADLAWFRVEKCHAECIIGQKDLCSHYHAETVEMGISPCIKQVTMKRELMEDLKQRLLAEDIDITPVSNGYIEIVSDAMIEYIFGQMLIKELQNMPIEITNQTEKDKGASVKLLMAISASSRHNRQHIAELLNSFGDYIKQIKPPPLPPPLSPPPSSPPPVHTEEDIPAKKEDVLQQFWEAKMKGITNANK